MIQKIATAVVVAGMLAFSGATFAAVSVDGLPQSVTSQWAVAEMAYSLATVQEAEETANEEEVDLDLDDEAMDPVKALELAERHAFIGMAHQLGIPASRNIQNTEAWAETWAGVMTQVEAGVTLGDALAAVEIEDHALLGVSPGKKKAVDLDETSLETLETLEIETTKVMNSTQSKVKDKENKGLNANAGDNGNANAGGNGKGNAGGNGNGNKNK